MVYTSINLTCSGKGVWPNAMTNSIAKTPIIRVKCPYLERLVISSTGLFGIHGMVTGRFPAV